MHSPNPKSKQGTTLQLVPTCVGKHSSRSVTFCAKSQVVWVPHHGHRRVPPRYRANGHLDLREDTYSVHNTEVH